MEWSRDGARLNRRRSCACPSALLDIGSWCNGSRRRYSPDDYYDDEDEEYAPLEYSAAGRTSQARWRVLWRRIVRGKKRAASVRVPYDAFSYAQNFEDQGTATWMEAENLTRSFSARFADPSRVLRSVG